MTTTTFPSDPNAWTNPAALDFAFQLQQRGPETIHEVLDHSGRASADHTRQLVAAAETLATANGRGPARVDGCTIVDEWLLESDYVPDQATVDRCVDRLETIVGQPRTIAQLGIPAARLQDLLTRLRQPARKIKRRPPKPDRKAFRELVKQLNTSTGDEDPGTSFDRQGNASVYLYHVTAEAACRLVNYRTVTSLELPLNESNDPRELAAALPILLRGWSQTLKYLSIDDVPHAAQARNRPRYKALAGCAAELANLPALETFITIRLIFDDELLSRVCENPRLSVIEVKGAEITRRAIDSFERCLSLESISISSCSEFPYAYRDELVARCPHAKIVEVWPPADKAKN